MRHFIARSVDRGRHAGRPPADNDEWEFIFINHSFLLIFNSPKSYPQSPKKAKNRDLDWCIKCIYKVYIIRKLKNEYRSNKH